MYYTLFKIVFLIAFASVIWKLFSDKKIAAVPSGPDTRQRLASARERLEPALERLALIEGLMKRFEGFSKPEEVLAYVNSLGCKNMQQINEKLQLVQFKGGYGDPLAKILSSTLQRDVLQDRWEFAFKVVLPSEEYRSLIDSSHSQRGQWRWRRDQLRLECSDLQVQIEELEAQIRKESPIENEPVFDPADKHAQLKKIRVDITGKRLEAERLEKAILDEQGEPIPNRRADGVPTDE